MFSTCARKSRRLQLPVLRPSRPHLPLRRICPRRQRQPPLPLPHHHLLWVRAAPPRRPPPSMPLVSADAWSMTPVLKASCAHALTAHPFSLIDRAAAAELGRIQDILANGLDGRPVSSVRVVSPTSTQRTPDLVVEFPDGTPPTRVEIRTFHPRSARPFRSTRTVSRCHPCPHRASHAEPN